MDFHLYTTMIINKLKEINTSTNNIKNVINPNNLKNFING